MQFENNLENQSVTVSKLIIGCGYLGKRVAAEWLDQGQRVSALTRSEEHADRFRSQGIEPIIGDVTGLKPGMNAKVEIISNELDNVLQAPVQAIFPAGDKYGCYVLTADGPQLVKGIEVGLTNNKTVLIKKGLKKGQRVVMNPRSQFTEVIRELEPKKKVRKITRKPAPKKRPTPAQRFKDADKNNDGKLSRDEIGSRMASFFDKIDANSDGGGDQKEYSAALAKMRSGGQRRGSGQRGKRAGGRGPR